MRRTARALSVAVLASAALGVCAGAGAADPVVPPPPADAGEPSAPPRAGDPEAVPPPSAEEALPPAAGRAAAQVSPADAAPGDTVTVSVSCGPTGGAAPASLDATSPAFEEGTVALRKVADDAGTTSGPAYRGTARIAAAEDFAADPAAPADPADPADPGDLADPEATGTEATEGAAADGTGGTEDWTVDGACPDASGGEDPWSATMTVPDEGGTGTAQPACREPAAPRTGASPRGASCAPTEPACPDIGTPHEGSSPQGTSCGGAKAEHGVRAGAGGTFGDSVPALVAGAVLIAGACGAAAHRLRLRLRGEDGER
ncbi:hypothetical protein ACWEWK_09420 [Streptomyces sp. NPDC003757]